MKQNSSILFHHMRKPLINSYLRNGEKTVTALISCIFVLLCPVSHAADKPEYLASFDPAKGFKPAQSDFTEVFLQIAGSLEYYGSPEPYMRHMKTEHERIAAKYQQRLGTSAKRFCPAYMTDEYFAKLTGIWTKLSPKLGLEPLTKQTGHLMREAINGTRNSGTMLVEIFNQHQAQVYAAMTGKSNETADFDSLKAELVKRLYLNQTTIHDENFGMAQGDAVDFTIGIQGGFTRLYSALDKSLTSIEAEKIKAIVTSIILDVGRMAESELEVGLAERALDRQTAGK